MTNEFIKSSISDINLVANLYSSASEALAQLKNILATGTLQALQDALDAGPSGANGP